MIARAIMTIGLGVAAASLVHAGTITLPGQIGGTYTVPVVSMKEAKFSATVRQQYDFSCGSAALATLLTHHYGDPVKEEQVFAEMYERGDQAKVQKEGFSLLDMKLYLEAHGFQADGFEAPLEQLEAAHIPAIVLIRENGYHHFVVLKGIRDGRVLIGDSSSGTRAVPRADFESMWINRILFVVRNHQDIAAFDRAADWRVTPRSPLRDVLNRDGLGTILLPKHGPGDF